VALSPLRRAFLVLLFVCLLLACSALSSPTFRTLSFATGSLFGSPLNLTNDVYNARYPAVAASGANVYVAWSEGSHGVYLRKSADNGSSFSPALRLSPVGGVAGYPVISANGSNVYIAWAQSVAANNISEIYFASSVDSGNIFATQVLSTADSITPAIASWNSSVYVSWSGGVPSNNGTYVRSSTDAGQTFGPAFQLSINNKENAIAAYGTSAYAISDFGYFDYTNDNGNTWKAYQISGGGLQPTIAAWGDNVYVASQTKNATHFFTLEVVSSNDSGTSFGPVFYPAGNVSNDWNPELGAYGSSVYLAFRSAYPQQTWIVNSADNGSSWGTPVSLSLSDDISGAPSLAVSGTSAYAIFGSSTNSSTNVWDAYVGYTNDSGSTWSTAPGWDVSGNTFGEAAPLTTVASASIAASGGNVYAAWMANETAPSNATNYQVFFNGPFASTNSTVVSTTFKCCTLSTVTDTSIQTISGNVSVSTFTNPPPTNGVPSPALIFDLIAVAVIVAVVIALVVLFIRRMRPAG
jgi:hypothetical protein